jgi:hypothetical protein
VVNTCSRALFQPGDPSSPLKKRVERQAAKQAEMKTMVGLEGGVQMIPEVFLGLFFVFVFSFGNSEV